MDPQRFKSISRAAVALALGGKFIRQVTENRLITFEITVPDGVDFDDPALLVPVPTLLAWIETLASRVREFNRQRGGVR